MEDKDTNIKDIGEFTVTDRPLKDTNESLGNNLQSISTIFHLGEDWVKQLPQNARLLNIGGGVSRLFEKQIKQERDDVLIVTIDPTLALNFKDNPYKWYIEEYDHGDYLIYKRGDKLKSKGDYSVPEDSEGYQKTRITSVTEIPGAIAALAPDLPFLPNTFDLFFDTFGPSHYMENTEQFQKYLTALQDSLKVGGTGYMNFINPSFIDLIDLNVETLNTVKLRINGEPEVRYTIKITKTAKKA